MTWTTPRSYAAQRRLDALNPIRQAVMGKTVEGHFGVGLTDYGGVEYVNIVLKGGGSLRIEPTRGGLDVSLRG